MEDLDDFEPEFETKVGLNYSKAYFIQSFFLFEIIKHKNEVLP